LSTPLLVHALAVSINMSAETATTFAGIGLSASRDPASGTFDLDDLNRHNIVEHDASLSRRDFALNGASQAFSAEIFAETLAHLGDAEDITIPAAAAARYGRVETERKRNENFTYGARQQFASYLESALYYQALRDARTGKTPVDFFKVLFEQERLPYKEGWR
ncbi:Chloroperoxidase, partial [Lojkania enalia]